MAARDATTASPRPEPIRGPVPAGESRALRRVTPLLYLLLAVVFVTFYTVRTSWWEWRVEGLTFAPPFPFRYRVLPISIAAMTWRLTHLPLVWIYAAMDTLSVWGALHAYQRLLRLHVRADLARVLAPGLLYGMAWHFCVMNLLHFPFDLPGMLLFVAGWWLLLERRWALYYPVLALATLNRETSLILPMIFALVEWGRLPRGRWATHLAAQGALWLGIKVALYLAFSGHPQHLFIDSLAKNRDTLLDVIAFRGEGPRVLAKFLLWCGGLWAALPFVIGRAPEAMRRSLIACVPFLIGMIFVATMREMRIYGEVIAIVQAPCLIWLARQLEPAAARAG